MAVLMRPSGEAAELTMGLGKQRGRGLSAAQVRRLRDLLCFVLVRVMQLSVDDAERVMNSGIGRRQIYNRLEMCPLDGQQLLRALIAGGKSRAE